MLNIGTIPNHWQLKKLGEICEVVTGTTPPKADTSNYGNDIPFFKPPHLWDDSVSDTEEKLSLKGGEKARLVPPNTVLVTCIGNLGRTGFVKKKAAFNQQLNAILENEIIGGKFIFYQAQSPLFRRQLEKLATGTTVSIVNKGNFETILISIPPLPEQQAIVSKIEELFCELDNGIAQLKTAKQQLKVYRQSLLKWLYEKSEESVPVKLINACEFITKGTTPAKEKLTSNNGEIPFLKVYNLTFNGSLDFSKDPTFVPKETHDVFLKRSKVCPDDVLMNIVGPPLGKVSIVPNHFPEWNINQAIVRFRCKEMLNNKYLLYFLLCDNTIRSYSRKAKATAGQFNLTLEICRDIVIPLPSLKKQQLIVSELESKLTVCEKIEETISQSLQQAETLRQSILKKAFSGELLKNHGNPKIK